MALEEEHGPHKKRLKTNSGLALPAPMCSPLDEPKPIGLRLQKSPLLLEVIQMKLSESNTQKVGAGHCTSTGKEEPKVTVASGDKLKASNFRASLLKIGGWEWKTIYEGDLVAKCYFAKRKLVWEVLDGEGLKNKIEIQWADIVALNASYPDDRPGTLDLVLARQPLFFKETNPQPRKHTNWLPTSDFTRGEASRHRRHYLEFPPGLLGYHFKKLIQFDPRLRFLSQQGEIPLNYPDFEPSLSMFDHQNRRGCGFYWSTEQSPPFYNVQHSYSHLGVESGSSKNNQEALFNHSESYLPETQSPCPATVTQTFGDIGFDQPDVLENWDMSDLESLQEHPIVEQGLSIEPAFSNEQWQSLHILDDGNQYSLTDIQHMLGPVNHALMSSRVHSLCDLLQGDTTSDLNAHPDIYVVQKNTDGSYDIEESAYENEFHDVYGDV